MSASFAWAVTAGLLACGGEVEELSAGGPRVVIHDLVGRGLWDFEENAVFEDRLQPVGVVFSTTAPLGTPFDLRITWPVQTVDGVSTPIDRPGFETPPRDAFEPLPVGLLRRHQSLIVDEMGEVVATFAGTPIVDGRMSGFEVLDRTMLAGFALDMTHSRFSRCTDTFVNVTVEGLGEIVKANNGLQRVWPMVADHQDRVYEETIAFEFDGFREVLEDGDLLEIELSREVLADFAAGPGSAAWDSRRATVRCRVDGDAAAGFFLAGMDRVQRVGLDRLEPRDLYEGSCQLIASATDECLRRLGLFNPFEAEGRDLVVDVDFKVHVSDEP